MIFEVSNFGDDGFSVLEEVIRGSASDVGLTTTWGRVKLKEGVFQCVVELHNGCLVSASITIIGGRENGDHISVVAPVVSFHNELMSPRHQGQSVRMVERLRNVLSKSVSGTSRGDTPTSAIIGIGPEQIAHGALVGDFL